MNILIVPILNVLHALMIDIAGKFQELIAIKEWKILEVNVRKQNMVNMTRLSALIVPTV